MKKRLSEKMKKMRELGDQEESLAAELERRTEERRKRREALCEGVAKGAGEGLGTLANELLHAIVKKARKAAEEV